jgi:hypothetical protein
VRTEGDQLAVTAAPGLGLELDDAHREAFARQPPLAP